MSAPNDGGAAFPYVVQAADGTPAYEAPGMSLRDYFAAHMPDLFAEWNFHQRAEAIGVTPDEWAKDPIGNAARFETLVRYRYADAMLSAREKRGA